MNASVTVPLVDGTVAPPGIGHPGAATRILEDDLGVRGGLRRSEDHQT